MFADDGILIVLCVVSITITVYTQRVRRIRLIYIFATTPNCELPHFIVGLEVPFVAGANATAVCMEDGVHVALNATPDQRPILSTRRLQGCDVFFF